MRNRLRILTIALFSLASVPAAAQIDSTAQVRNAPMLDYEHPKQYIINKVKVSGIKYLDPEVVASMSGLTKGDTIMIPSDYLSSTLKTMWNQRIYSDVQILTEPVGDSVNIEIVLRERPRVYDWKIEGVRKGQMSELLETLKLKKGSELSDFVLNSSKDAIRKYFAEKGFYNADVSVRLENDTTLENVVNVFFVVDRKNRVKIGKIDFEGNTALSDRQLRRSFKKTHQKSINIFKGAKYKEKDYEEDKENLIDFYNSRGYRNATILSDSVYRINDKRLGIALKVDEGNKFYYRNVSWTGNSVYETRQLNDMLGISKGETYDKKTLHKRLGIGKHADYEDMSSISSLYQNNGYLFSSIDPGEVVVGEDSIDINVKIFEGKQAKINEVRISGNHRVNDRVIRRELYVRPGELYNRALLMQTIRQLNQMQHFDPEKTSPGIDLVPNSNELVDISFPLEEVASDKFEISGGWGSNMFVGSVGVQLNNVSLKNFFKGSEWRPYPHGQNQQLAIRGQTNGSYYKAISLNFTEPWLGGKKPNSLTVGLYYSDETDAYYAWQSGNRHFRTIGVSVGIGRRLSWPDRYFTIYNEYQLSGIQSERLVELSGNQRYVEHLRAEDGARPQFGRLADLSAYGFRVLAVADADAALLAVPEECRLCRPEPSGLQAVQVDRISQVAVQGPVVLPADQQQQAGADGPCRNGISGLLQQEQAVAFRGIRRGRRRHVGIQCIRRGDRRPERLREQRADSVYLYGRRPCGLCSRLQQVHDGDTLPVYPEAVVHDLWSGICGRR